MTHQEGPGDALREAQRRLYVLSKLVEIAHAEMPERLNNATRVNVNHAASYAAGGYSSGLTRDLEAEFDSRAALSGDAESGRLDVERLAEAIHVVRNHSFDGSESMHPNEHQIGSSIRQEAHELAAEYERLSR